MHGRLVRMIQVISEKSKCIILKKAARNPLKIQMVTQPAQVIREIEGQPPVADALRALPDAVWSRCEVLSAAAGDVMARLGTAPQWLMVVIVGELHLVRYLPNGAVAVLQRSTGGFVAEASLDAPRYHCHILAAAPSRVLRIPLALFRSEMASNEVLRSVWIRRLTREVVRLRAQSERLRLKSAADRVAHYIESEGTQARLVLSQTRKAWAAELGLSHESLYRTLAEMERDGVLTTTSNDDSFVLTLTTAGGAKHG